MNKSHGFKADWRIWLSRATVVVLLLGLLSTALAIRADLASGSLYGTGLTAPAAVMWVPGALGGHLWISDHLQGLCRLDPSPDKTSVAINGFTCFKFGIGAGSAGQASFDPTTNFVYVPDSSSKSLGVWRLIFNWSNETFGNPVVIAGGLISGFDRPMTATLGPDGKVYVGFKRDGQIVRIVGPAGAPGSQTVESVGTTLNNRIISSLGFIGNDLYVAEIAQLSMIANATSCAGDCIPTPTNIHVLAPADFAFDGTYIYAADPHTVVRYNMTSGVQDLYATAGNVYGSWVPFAGISSLGFDQNGRLLVADDPTLGINPLSARLWTLSTGTIPPPPAPPMVTGTLYATNLTIPSGSVWLPGALGGHLWIADHLQGFCRLDPDAGGQTASLNTATCNNLNKGAVGQPSFDPATNSVYVPDGSAKSLGVWQLKYISTTETVDAGAVMPASLGLGAMRPQATALGPDGKLYLGFKGRRNGEILRIANPSTTAQTLESVGYTSNFRLALTLGFIRNDLYIAEAANLTSLSDVTSPWGGGVAIPTNVQVLAPTDFAWDGGHYLYVADLSSVIRYDMDTGAQVLYANSGLVGSVNTPFAGISSLGFDPQGNLLVADDPTFGIAPLRGHLWLVPTGSPPPAPVPPPAPPPPPSRPGDTLYLSALTNPAGTIWITGTLGGHLWLSDQVKGICRLDPSPDGKTATLNLSTCNNLRKGAAGQASYDPVNHLLYVPDSGTKSIGVFRLQFDPTTETISGTVSLVGGGQIISTNRPGSALLGPDGNLYVTYLQSGLIQRVTTPGGASQTVSTIGSSSDGFKIVSAAFVGGDLYLAETANVSVIPNVASCTFACRAAPSGPNVAAPLAITYDGGMNVYIGDLTSVLRYNLITHAQTVYAASGVLNGASTPFSFVTGLGLDPQGNLYVGDDPSLGKNLLQGRLWKVVNVP